MTRRIQDIFVNGIAASGLLTRSIRYIIYRAFGIKTQTKGIRIGCYFDNLDVKIGYKTYINQGCFFSGPIEIGANCAFGPQVMLCSASHEIGPKERRAGRPTNKPIIVKDGCWVGTRVVILPGITIGEGCIIAAGAVVATDCEANSLYAGVPAKKIKDLPQ